MTDTSSWGLLGAVGEMMKQDLSRWGEPPHEVVRAGSRPLCSWGGPRLSSVGGHHAPAALPGPEARSEGPRPPLGEETERFSFLEGEFVTTERLGCGLFVHLKVQFLVAKASCSRHHAVVC